MMTSCCLTCCDLKQNEVDEKQYSKTTIVLKIFQIVFIVLSIIAIEGVLIFLNSLHIPWKKDYVSLDINRVTLWLSLATTIGMLVAILRKYNKRFYQVLTPVTCTSCSGYLKSERKHHQIKLQSRWSLNYLDFLHSFIIALSFLSCTFWLVVNIPSEYDHHMEVGVKVFCFIFDLFLGLLFTKTCVVAYTDYVGPPVCSCQEQTLYVTPFKDEHSSDEELQTLISRNENNSSKSNDSITNVVSSS